MTTTLAEEFGGLVVFAEHRYFGESFPFSKEEAFLPDNVRYLTVEQVMMDYVDLVKHIKYTYACEDCPVIVFGGSYGGMLAAWLRFKHPAHFQGALAASAPIRYFKGAADPDGFTMIITEDFKNASEKCPVLIKESWEILMDLKTRNGTWEQASEILNTCSVVNASNQFDALY
jgi:lysosomal Pro-X carboxypeptidase